MNADQAEKEHAQQVERRADEVRAMQAVAIRAQIDDTVQKRQRVRRIAAYWLFFLVLSVGGGLLISITLQIQRKLQDATELDRRLVALRAEEVDLRTKVEDQRKALATLTRTAEEIYGVRVTAGNQVYQLRATAKPLRKRSTAGSLFDFSIFINSSDETLDRIQRVIYTMDHPTFANPTMISNDRGNRFAVTYVGWGCLNKVGVAVELKPTTDPKVPSGPSVETHKFEFNMCESLGWR